MPGEYETLDGRRLFRLQADLRAEPELAVATLVHGVVRDLLQQSGYAYSHFPELVDLAVIGTGLGVPQSRIDFVAASGSFWDPTQWRVVPRPFLDAAGVSYAHALSAWIREQATPPWIADLPAECRRSALKSLKYLQRTDDCFCNLRDADGSMRDWPQNRWIQLANQRSLSGQIIALQNFCEDPSVSAEQQLTIGERLRSNQPAVVVHAVDAAEKALHPSDHVIEELRFLTQHRDSAIRAKAMCALSRLDCVDESVLATAAGMLGSKIRHEIFAGLRALSSQGSIAEHLVPAINRSFIRNLQVCDYEFINLFAAMFVKWLDDPQAHVRQLVLEEGGPEYMDIAIEAIEQVGAKATVLN